MTSLVQKKFGEAAADYAASSVHAKGESLARLVALVAPQSSWRVLDVATGAGHTALAFAPHVAKVTASDVTDQMLAEAKKLAAERGLGNVRTARAKAEDLPFPDMSFDLVTCRLAAHHFANPRAFVAEAYRVLMPDGVLAVVDNLSPDEPELARAYNEYEKLRDPSHGRCLGLAQWTALLGDAGFAVTHSETIDQTIEFDPWTKRMRCDAPTVARLKALLGAEPLYSYLRPRESDKGLVFTLQEVIIVARKPGKQRTSTKAPLQAKGSA
ncbi:MAG TPA: methyltransferase domain-containing protein [Methyloceanibacter sp.]|nr:methyltransferase domain-containing protein [Methyloceanibacter sp.]